MADYPFKGYDNEVLTEQIESTLLTKVDMARFYTSDFSLTENPGMKKVIHKYTGSGEAEDLARGAANSKFIDAAYTSEEYTVARTQSQTKWYDDDEMNDPKLIETKVNTVAESIANALSTKAIDQFMRSSNGSPAENWSLGSFADAIAKYANIYESQEGLFFLCNVSMVPTLRRMLGDYLQPTEAFIRTGAIGSILGCGVYTTKHPGIPDGVVICATRDAVTAFQKKLPFVERDRDIDKKENFLVCSYYNIIALTNESKCILMAAPQETPVTITTYTKNAKTIAGAATDGAKVEAFVNGVKTGSVATASSSAYSITADENLVAGDIVKVVARIDGTAPSVYTVTVAE